MARKVFHRGTFRRCSAPAWITAATKKHKSTEEKSFVPLRIFVADLFLQVETHTYGAGTPWQIPFGRCFEVFVESITRCLTKPETPRKEVARCGGQENDSFHAIVCGALEEVLGQA